MDVPVSDAILVIYLNILSFLAFFRDKRTEEDPGEGCVEEAGTAVAPPFSALFGLSWALGALQCFGHTTGKAEFKPIFSFCLLVVLVVALTAPWPPQDPRVETGRER